ncbi:NAD-dependent epimerase/dehydratase family protein [Enterococcus casseliflavus]|uniref:GDP-mannose 4,6-dehydratase n=1 Tax=Enterococcus casseliflavus TaxID=37734 RepID=UPI001432996C|nr:GDP-mannose 4,6-dehydratase [Enterococcus casseliflavus]NKD37697.1 NAD-dependent epimerase/dehydratase family protein [Enterococcus casseliflavus]
MKILVTGSCGFIGYHLSKKLLESDNIVVGIDNINDYYDTNLKMKRLSFLEKEKNFTFKKVDLVESDLLDDLFLNEKFDIVINLAAQAGVRYSIENPKAYLDANLIGFFNILEACKKHSISKLIYASSSSVYGGNDKVPFSEDDQVDRPVSLYAATKKSNELLAYSYSSLYKMKTIGLRFFTVYGELGRPDMAYFSFTKNISEGKKISLFNNGNMSRDFTYIGDIVESINYLLDENLDNKIFTDKKNEYYKILNIGNNSPVALKKFVRILEKHIGKEAVIEYKEMQKGDVEKTFADTEKLEKITGFKPLTSLDDGLKKFVDWYKDYNER